MLIINLMASTPNLQIRDRTVDLTPPKSLQTPTCTTVSHSDDETEQLFRRKGICLYQYLLAQNEHMTHEAKQFGRTCTQIDLDELK